MKRFVNRNCFPVLVPGKMGNDVCFRPGEGTTEIWFSRFVGERLLSVEEVSVPAAPTPEPAFAVPPITPPILEEKTDTFERRSGIYYCSLCKNFRAGSRMALETHLAEKHGIGEELAPPPPLEPVAAVPQMPDQQTTESTEAPSSSEAQPVGQPPAQPVEEAETGQEEGVIEGPPYKCPVCGRFFRTLAGLGRHKSAKHSA
jgi:hypothetical protein